jgi:hypothetical protein
LSDEVLATSARTLSAVFIFGGDITRAERPEHLGGLGWRSLRKLEPDKTGPMPSYERVLAGAVLHRMNPALILIPSAGQSNLEGAGATPPIASVMAAEVRELGLIIEEQKSFVTKDHFITCSAIARERGWKATEIGILSLFWHFGRITAMMTMMRAEKPGTIEPLVPGVTRLISVERVLASDDPAKWNGYSADLCADPAMAQTLAREAVGVGQLWSGHAPQFGSPYKGFRDPLDLS